MKRIILITVFLLANHLLFSQEYLKSFRTITAFKASNSIAYFAADDGKNGVELWKTDGTKKGTVLVKNIRYGNDASKPNQLTFYKNHLYFVANNESHGSELWRTDGTKEGTFIVKDIYAQSRQGSGPIRLKVYNDELYFFATDGGHRSLWKTDGTDKGTVKVAKIDNKRLSHFVETSRGLYFAAGGTLKKLDDQGKIQDIKLDDQPYISELNTFNDNVYLITHTSYRANVKLYKIDTNDKAILLKEYKKPQYGGLEIGNFAVVNSNVYFSIRTDYNNGKHEDVLWKTDGSSKGTVAIRTFNWDPHLSNSHISNFIEFKGKLYFNAGFSHNHTLWVSDGTIAGTKNFINIPLSNVRMLTHKQKLFYISNNRIHYTDGTSNKINKVSTQRIAARKSDDSFIIDKGINTIFFEVQANNNDANSFNKLFTINKAPNLIIKEDYRPIFNDEKLNFQTQIDGLVKKSITITNTGNKALSFREISVVGDGYYLKSQDDSNINTTNTKGNFKQVLLPGESSKFSLGFYPSSDEDRHGNLNIYSNDSEFPIFSLRLYGKVSNEVSKNSFTDFPLEKVIDFNHNRSSILQQNFIAENMPVNTIIGDLSINNNTDFTFSLIEGDGANNNNDITLSGNQILSSKVFDYESENTLSVRIKAVSNSSGKVYEDIVIIHIKDVYEPIIEKCKKGIIDISSGFSDVALVDDDTIIAIGYSGKMYMSVDGGKNWTEKIIPNLNGSMKNIQFVSKKIGYIAGDSFLLKTEDGGKNWFLLTRLPYIKNLKFIDTEVGFVFGKKGRIFKTINGGKDWKNISINIDLQITAAHFFDAKKGYIVFNDKVLRKTQDGGNTWENITIDIKKLDFNEKFVDIQFIDSNTGFIITDQGKIIKTENDEDWYYDTNLSISNPTRMKFKNKNEGYVIGGFYRGMIFTTSDGGKSWKEIDEVVHFASLTGIDFSNSKTIVVGLGNSFTSGLTNNGHILFELKDKNTIDIISLLPGIGHPRAVDFKGNIGIWLAGSYDGKNFDQLSRITTNHGITWSNINLPKDTHYLSHSFIFDNIITVFGRRVMYVSSDLGKTFTSHKTPDFHIIKRILKDTLIGYSSTDTTIYSSTDKGITWKKLSTFQPLAMDTYFFDKDNGFISSLSGLYTTSDSGKNWSKIELDKKAGYTPLYSVHFKDKMNGIIGSSNGTFYITPDGGKNWQTIYTRLGVNITQIFNHDNQWFCILENGNVGTSVDGKIWDSVSGTGSKINSYTINHDTLYLTGGRGALYKYKTNSSFLTTSIKGKKNITEGEVSKYSVGTATEIHNIWSVSGKNQILSTSKNEILVKWLEPGKQTITVTSSNNCGNTETRTVNLIVNKDIKKDLTIKGDNEVLQFSEKVYTTNLYPNSRYTWNVTGHKAFIPNNNSLNIDWGSIGKGNIDLILTNLVTGHRIHKKLEVDIRNALNLDDHLITEKVTVYPNPFTEYITIHLEESIVNDTNLKVYLIDLLGKQKEVFPQIGSNKKNLKLNLQNFKPGIYILKIHTKDLGKFSKKIIKY